MKKTLNLQQLRHEIRDVLIDFRENGIANQLDEQYGKPKFEQMSFEQRLLIALTNEQLRRSQVRYERLVRHSGMRTVERVARLEDILYTPSRKLNRALLEQLKTGDWMTRENPANLIICGACGTGKSFMAGAFANDACERNISVMFGDAAILLSEIAAARMNGTLEKKLKQVSKTKLLILDDLFSSTLTEQNCADLLQIIKHREHLHSMIITSQYPLQAWRDILKHNVVSDAILDRLINSSYCLDLKGPSLRKSILFNK